MVLILENGLSIESEINRGIFSMVHIVFSWKSLSVNLSVWLYEPLITHFHITLISEP